MLTNTSRIPEDRRVYLLADHLDAILATGEDLKCLFHDRARASFATSDSDSLNLESFVAKARRLEFAVMGRIKLANIQAEEIGRRDGRIGALARLFASATSVVVDAIDDVCDSEHHAFLNGFDPLVYLRGRGLIAKEAGCLKVAEQIAVNDGFLIAERIELGVLMDMCAEFLNFMDRHFDLFNAAVPPTALLPAPHLPCANSSAAVSAVKDFSWKNIFGFSIGSLRA
ncbi:MAG: hypothetical protein AAFR90_00155 [Pseudomonadota bacterium]